MLMIRIVTDSTADIPDAIAAELGISVVPSYVIFGDQTYRDGVELTKEQFYRLLSSSDLLPTTAAPPPATYEQVYRELAREASDILSIHLAARLSALASSATLGARDVPEARITIVDSGQVTMGYGWLAIAAAEAAHRGDSLEAIVAAVEQMKARTRVVAVLDTLEFLKRGGRVGWARALLGTLLRIKPIIEIYDSQVSLLARIRTQGRALDYLMDYVESLGPLERAIVLHTGALPLAEEIAGRLQALHPAWPRLIGEAGVTIASHAGPGAVGLALVTAL
jgi:DegV family protein with EDD domain